MVLEIARFILGSDSFTALGIPVGNTDDLDATQTRKHPAMTLSHRANADDSDSKGIHRGVLLRYTIAMHRGSLLKLVAAVACRAKPRMGPSFVPGRLIVWSFLGGQRLSTAANITPQASRVAIDQAMRGYIAGDDCPGADHSKLADGNPRQYYGACADRGAALDKDRIYLPVIGRLERTIGVNSTWQVVVGQDNPGAQKDAILKGGTVIDVDAIL
jgi:hypothetical protein